MDSNVAEWKEGANNEALLYRTQERLRNWRQGKDGLNEGLLEFRLFEHFSHPLKPGIWGFIVQKIEPSHLGFSDDKYSLGLEWVTLLEMRITLNSAEWLVSSLSLFL